MIICHFLNKYDNNFTQEITTVFYGLLVDGDDRSNCCFSAKFFGKY